MLRLVTSIAILLTVPLCAAAADAPRPNILWITSEDHGPHLGCYGDEYATTPHADALAKRGLRYRVCWSNAPVCAPARTTLITGLYGPTSGGHHMRSMVSLPADMKLFPHYLREAGYYCTNNVKEDYNVAKPAGTWDASSNKAHWRNRSAGQPFFAVFNSTKSHESQIRTRPHKAEHDPAQVRVPAYHPDTPEVRQDWAQYYDQVTAADRDAGKVLAELEQDGLVDDTIIFCFADHGSGMPRNKRFAGDSGLHAPLIAYFPEKYKHLAPGDYKPGGVSDRLVSFVDFAPTMLSIAGVKPPKWMQGHAFAGKHATQPQTYVFGFRDRMDERYDLVRSVRDERYVYIRNFMPHLPHGQHVSYMFQTPTTRVWKKLFDQRQLTPEQSYFWEKKAPEELYDLTSDPDEVHNLATSPEHRKTLLRLRGTLVEHLLHTRDLGFLPEAELHARLDGKTPYELGRDEDRYPLPRILKSAMLVGMPDEPFDPARMEDDDSAVRYWAVMQLLAGKYDAVPGASDQLRLRLKDSCPNVAVPAAECLGTHGDDDERAASLATLLEYAAPERHGQILPIAALNAIDALGGEAASAAEALAKVKRVGKSPHARYNDYVGRLLDDLGEKLK